MTGMGGGRCHVARPRRPPRPVCESAPPLAVAAARGPVDAASGCEAAPNPAERVTLVLARACRELAPAAASSSACAAASRLSRARAAVANEPAARRYRFAFRWRRGREDAGARSRKPSVKLGMPDPSRRREARLWLGTFDSSESDPAPPVPKRRSRGDFGRCEPLEAAAAAEPAHRSADARSIDMPKRDSPRVDDRGETLGGLDDTRTAPGLE